MSKTTVLSLTEASRVRSVLSLTEASRVRCSVEFLQIFLKEVGVTRMHSLSSRRRMHSLSSPSHSKQQKKEMRIRCNSDVHSSNSVRFSVFFFCEDLFILVLYVRIL